MLVREFSNYLLAFVMMIIAICSLFAIKDKVNTLNYQLSEVGRQINYERNAIHVLKAEFSYLSSPQRLKQLYPQYLELEPVSIAQMIKDPLIYQYDEHQLTLKQLSIMEANLIKPKVKWRYKKSAVKYLHMVSDKR